MLRRLRRHLTLLCALITGAILCGMALFMLRSSERQLIQSSRITLEGTVNAIVYRLRSEQVLDWDWLSQTEAAERLIIHISESGHPLHYPGSWKPLSGRERLIALGQEKAAKLGARRTGEDAFMEPEEVRTTIFELWGDMGERYLCASVYIPMNRSYRELLLLRDMRALDGQIVSQRLLYAGLVGASVLLLALFGWWFSGHALRPVAESQRRQSEFIAAASHELRTPLAVVQATGELLLDHPESRIVDRFEDVNVITEETKRLARLVDSLMELSLDDAGRAQPNRQPVEVDGLVRDVAALYEDFVALQGKQVRFEPGFGGTVPADADRLRQLLAIVLDNAVKYTAAGDEIVVTTGAQGQKCFLTVVDTGCGIDPEDRERVFERFFRADKARSRATGGHGLGLSLAQSIVQAHGGTICLVANEPRGTVVTITLPR